MKDLHALLVVVLISAFVAGISGCSLVAKLRGPKPDTARELFRAGTAAMQEEDYAEAVEHFTAIKERYPFSEYTTKAELKLADAYFQDERLESAEQAYKEFETLHPGSKEIPYVLFQIGLCNYKQFRSIDLPMRNLGEALQYFNRLEQSYPESPLVTKAREYRTRTRRLMAKHELFVADFYLRRGDYQAAWKRYRYVQERYPDLQAISKYARSQGRLAYFKYQEAQAERERAAQEGDWKQWFRWL